MTAQSPEGPPLRSQPDVVHVYLDEAFDPWSSGCAVVIAGGTEADIATKLQALIDEHREDAYLAGNASYDTFRERGPHATSDLPVESKALFLQQINRMYGARALVYTWPAKCKYTKYEAVLLSYTVALRNIVRQYPDGTRFLVVFEEHEELAAFYMKIPSLVLNSLASNSTIEASCKPKGSDALLILPDYILHTVNAALSEFYDKKFKHCPSRNSLREWSRSPTDGKDTFLQRNFRAVDPSLSLVYDFSRGTLLSSTKGALPDVD